MSYSMIYALKKTGSFAKGQSTSTGPVFFPGTDAAQWSLEGSCTIRGQKGSGFRFFLGGCGGFNAGHLWVVSRTISMIYLYLIYQDLIYFYILLREDEPNLMHIFFRDELKPPGLMILRWRFLEWLETTKNIGVFSGDRHDPLETHDPLVRLCFLQLYFFLIFERFLVFQRFGPRIHAPWICLPLVHPSCNQTLRNWKYSFHSGSGAIWEVLQKHACHQTWPRNASFEHVLPVLYTSDFHHFYFSLVANEIPIVQSKGVVQFFSEVCFLKLLMIMFILSNFRNNVFSGWKNIKR